MSDVADLAGQAELSEAGQRLPIGVESTAGVRGGDGERDREVGAGFVDSDTAGDIHEHIGCGKGEARVAGQDRDSP